MSVKVAPGRFVPAGFEPFGRFCTRNGVFGVRDKNRHLPTPCLERWGHREVDAARGGDGSLDGFVTLFCEADLCA